MFLFKVKQAAYTVACPKDGDPITLFVKPHNNAASAGDIVIVGAIDNHTQRVVPKACFVISSILEGDPVCFSVVIEKFDASKKASHLIRYNSGLVEWKNIRGGSTRVLYMNGEEISPAILSSSQIEGITVKIIRSQYTLQVFSHNCIMLPEGELNFDELKPVQVQTRVEDIEQIKRIQQIIKDRNGGDITEPFAIGDNNENNYSEDAPTFVAQPYNSSNGHQAAKREAENVNEDAVRQNKKIRASSISSPPSPNASPPSSAPSSPAKQPPNIDLIKHIAEVAQMVKEMDDEHSDRLSKVEMEIVRIRSILQQHSLFTSHLSMVSPSLTSSNSSTSKRRGKSTKNSQKPRSIFNISDMHAGELVAVRADKAVSPDSYYWIARVVSVGKNTIKVKWFEPYEFAQNWFYLDNKEDEVDIATVFAKNFEVILKPTRHPSGHYIDIYKPASELSKLDAEK